MTTRQPARPATAGWPVHERSILGSVLGLPGYAAIGIALGFTGLGVFIDLNRINGLGAIFKACYFAGCLLAVCWVKRRALFGPMVQPPLLLAIAVPAVVLASDAGGGSSGGTGLTDNLLTIGAPLLNSFPTMAVTTAFAVAIGLGRYALQRPTGAEPTVRRRPVSPPSGGRSAGSAARARSGTARPAARTRGPATGVDRVTGERGTAGAAERRSVRDRGRGGSAGRSAEWGTRDRAPRDAGIRDRPADQGLGRGVDSPRRGSGGIRGRDGHDQPAAGPGGRDRSAERLPPPPAVDPRSRSSLRPNQRPSARGSRP